MTLVKLWSVRTKSHGIEHAILEIFQDKQAEEYFLYSGKIPLVLHWVSIGPENALELL